MTGRADEFLSDEDLDLKNLPLEEVLAWYRLWLEQAQASNEADAHLYSHGVFTVDPRYEGPRPPADRFL